jgi:hypothetical protein
MTDMAAAVRRCSLRRPQEDQTFPRIAVAPDRDLIAGYGVAIVPTAALGGIVVVGERDRCEQTISGNKGDPHADLAMPAATKGPNLRTNTEQPLISFFALALRTIAHQVSSQARASAMGREAQKMPYKPTRRS